MRPFFAIAISKRLFNNLKRPYFYVTTTFYSHCRSKHRFDNPHSRPANLCDTFSAFPIGSPAPNQSQSRPTFRSLLPLLYIFKTAVTNTLTTQNSVVVVNHVSLFGLHSLAITYHGCDDTVAVSSLVLSAVPFSLSSSFQFHCQRIVFRRHLSHLCRRMMIKRLPERQMRCMCHVI